MGRRLAGPVKLPGGGDSWYARLTVKLSERPRAGCTRLTRSLGTTDHTTALERWPGAYKALQEELRLRVEGSDDVSLLRARLSSVVGYETTSGDGIADKSLSIREQAELVVGKQLDPQDSLHVHVYESIEAGATLQLTWNELLSVYESAKNRRRGRPVTASTIKNIRQAIKSIVPIQPFPALLSKQEVRQLIASYEANSLKPKTIAVKCGLLQSLIQTGIEEDALGETTINPFTLVSFSGATRDEDRRRGFTMQEIEILKTSKYWPIFRLLIGSSMRIGELWSRRHEDLDGNMLIIRDNPALNWRPKTKSSYRRIPLDTAAASTLLETVPVSSVQGFEKRLRDEVRRLFPDDLTLTVHSTRHTFKSLSRMVGMSADISDEIDGHKKSTVSAVSDAYGMYPDSTLIEANSKVWEVLS
jgi:integrase